MSKKSDIKGFDKTLPDMRQNGYDRQKVENYINSIKQPNSEDLVIGYAHGQGTLPNNAYVGGVYSPTQNRIYFAPFEWSSSSLWHFIDCNNGSVVSYSHGTGIGINAYAGAVYSPTQNRIYFAPHGQGNQSNWHYIRCSDGAVISYTHNGITAVSSAYIGGIYSPTQNRIYFAPFGQGNQSKWHYVDCNSVAANDFIVEYDSATAVASAYRSGVYSPTQDRIYFIPSVQGNQSNWHYIRCSDGAVISYQHTGITAVSDAYGGGVYSPTQNRIYLVPLGQGANVNWHFIDCNLTGNDNFIIAYQHTGFTSLGSSFLGGAYSPTQNKIYFAPFGESDSLTWVYIDCETGTVVPYTHAGYTSVDGGFTGGVYSPIENRIYFIPYNNQTNWCYIKPFTTNNANISLMSGTIFNKY